MVRAKFTCNYKQPQYVTGQTHKIEGWHLHFTPVTTGSTENENFFRYTPGGNLSMWCVNPAASDQFEMGKEYYLDITPAS